MNAVALNAWESESKLLEFRYRRHTHTHTTVTPALSQRWKHHKTTVRLGVCGKTLIAQCRR